MKNLGLTEQNLLDIRDILEFYPDITWAKIFGSRAKGNYKPNSDVDISLGGCISQETLGLISLDLEELDTPYKFDVNNYDKLNHLRLKDHINRVGVTFYQRD